MRSPFQYYAIVKNNFDRAVQSELLRRGFVYAQKAYYRKSGNILQGIGMVNGFVKYNLAPFWAADDKNGFHTKNNGILFLSGQFMFRYLNSTSFYDAPEEAFEQLKTKYLDDLDAVCDEGSYLKHLFGMGAGCSAVRSAILYECCKQGSFEPARACLEIFKEKYFEERRRILMNDFSRTKEEIDRGDWFFADNLGAGDIAKSLIEGKNMTFSSSYKRERPCDPAVKAKIEEETENAVRLNFQWLLDVMAEKNHDFSDVLKYKEENEPLMRAVIKKKLGLEF